MSTSNNSSDSTIGSVNVTAGTESTKKLEQTSNQIADASFVMSAAVDLDLESLLGYRKAHTEPLLAALKSKKLKTKQNLVYPEKICGQISESEDSHSDDEWRHRRRHLKECPNCGEQLQKKRYLDSLSGDLDNSELSKMNPRRLRARLEEKVEGFKLYHNYKIKKALYILLAATALMFLVVLLPNILEDSSCDTEETRCPPFGSPYKQGHAHCCDHAQMCCLDEEGVGSCCDQGSTCCGGRCCPWEEQCCGNVCVPLEYSCCRAGVYCGKELSCCTLTKDIVSCCPTAELNRTISLTNP